MSNPTEIYNLNYPYINYQNVETVEEQYYNNSDYDEPDGRFK